MTINLKNLGAGPYVGEGLEELTQTTNGSHSTATPRSWRRQGCGASTSRSLSNVPWVRRSSSHGHAAKEDGWTGGLELIAALR